MLTANVVVVFFFCYPGREGIERWVATPSTARIERDHIQAHGYLKKKRKKKMARESVCAFFRLFFFSLFEF